MSEVQTAKMIYADKVVANAILEKMKARSPEDLFNVVQLPTGWQVCRITKCAPYMPPAKPLPIMKPGDASQIISGDVVTFVAPFERQTDKWLYFASEQGPGTVRYVHKNHLINFEVADKLVTVSMRQSTAIAKGLI
jgi:hypothetical protein